LAQEIDWGGIDVPNKHIVLIFGFTSITVFAEDARQLTCSGNDDRAKRDVPIA
jgi:hypothetical protein